MLEYLPDLGDALAACDLALARSGGSVFELTAAGRRRGAGALPVRDRQPTSTRTRAGWRTPAPRIVIEDAELTAELLRERVAPMLGRAASGWRRWARPRAAIAKPDAAERIAAEILSFV